MAEYNEWQQRVVGEKKALDEKVAKLAAFLATAPTPSILHPLDRNLLIQQEILMARYSAILEARIERFSLQ